jgi:uncharacterized membrane protein YeaQ/YmgE (transglycosylase-associated protein family)
MTIIGLLIIGIVAGFLARLIVPGRDPMGFVATVVLGIVGAFVGGFLAKALFNDDSVGWFGATVGAVIVLLIWNAVVANRRHGIKGFGRRAMS